VAVGNVIPITDRSYMPGRSASATLFQPGSIIPLREGDAVFFPPSHMFRVHSVVRYREHERPGETRPHHVTVFDVVLADTVEAAIGKVRRHYHEVVAIYSVNHIGEVTIP
jgi:hypothetical protein